MSHFGQVLEDPEYYDAGDAAWDAAMDEDEFEDDVNFISEMERYNPFNTINS
jgi:hypothetical protein